LFRGYLGMPERCAVCELDYDFADAGDGPAVFIILIVGMIVVVGALAVELTWQPPYWVHAALWLPLLLVLCLGTLRPLKGAMIGQQYRHSAQEGRLDKSS
jgi:uncharacterized protein (DUF983 family)